MIDDRASCDLVHPPFERLLVTQPTSRPVEPEQRILCDVRRVLGHPPSNERMDRVCDRGRVRVAAARIGVRTPTALVDPHPGMMAASHLGDQSSNPRREGNLELTRFG
jgi:hypothetical protein